MKMEDQALFTYGFDAILGRSVRWSGTPSIVSAKGQLYKTTPFPLLRLCRTQRVVGDVYSITLEIETADHDNPFARYDDIMSINYLETHVPKSFLWDVTEPI